MTLIEIAKRFEKVAVDNSPAILTAIGVTGVVVVAFLTGKATFTAADILKEEQARQDLFERPDNVDPESYKMDNKEKFVLIWKQYIPATGAVVLTIVCIVGANRIGSRRAAALAAAYTISEKAYAEYKDKIVEKFGEKKEKNVRDDVAQDRVNRNPMSGTTVIAGDGVVLCYEAFTGRYFKSDMETLKKGQNDTNAQIIHDSYASLTDFYNNIGLPSTKISDELGWTSDKLMEIKYSSCLSEDNKPCISIDFNVSPVRDYYKFS